MRRASISRRSPSSACRSTTANGPPDLVRGPAARRSRSPKQTLAQQLGKAIALLLVLGLVLLLQRYCSLAPETFGPGAKIVAIDGDTLRANSGEEYRIFGIDAPELHQSCTDEKGKEWACGRAAKTALAKLIKGGEVSCVEKATDRYGRNVAQCRAKRCARISARPWCVKGYAIDLGRKTGHVYAGAESEARAAGRGIWGGTFQRPGAWRQDHPRSN